MTFTVEYEREDDGRWLAETLELPGILPYGNSADEAIAKVQALALRAVLSGWNMARRREFVCGKERYEYRT